MSNKYLLPVVCVALILSGCGKESGSVFGFGASSDKARDVSVSQESKDAETKTMEAGRTSSVTKTGYSQRIIAETLVGLAVENHLRVMETRSAFFSRSDLLSILENDDDKVRNQLSGIVASVIAPVMGWPKEARNGFRFNAAAASKYANGVTASLLFADSTFQMLDAEVKKTTVRNPAAAQKAIRKLYIEGDIEKLKTAWADAVLKAKANCADIVIDTASADGTAWQCPNGAIDVQGSKSGYVMMVGGKPYFGDGYISGMESKIAYDDSNATKVAKSSETSISEGSSTKETNTTTTGAKIQ
jgi:hypothetical protein